MKEKDYQSLINERANNLFEVMRQRVSEADMIRIQDAFNLALEAHAPQRRKSGEPYIFHPIAVATIVAKELELGANPVIAALLHDVVEDTSHTLEDIKRQFGDDVEFLVKVVTKQKKERYERSKQVDNYRQILDSVKYDIRALLVKLADRLHNMRTLSSMRPDKQMKIAGETDYFYAPLANRLGLYHVKSELENLSFRYRCPQEFATIDKLLRDEEARIGDYLTSFTSEIGNALRAHGIEARTEVRYRTPYSVWRKMHQNNCDFSHVTGRHYIRIIFPNDMKWSEKDVSLKIYSVLTDTFKERPGSLTNYINAPKENGYQSFHVKLLSHQGEWEEVHISSERMVRNSRLGCAAERKEENVVEWIAKFKSILKEVNFHDSLVDYMDSVTITFHHDDIMVFTPKGQGIILPKNATALDFAFEIHDWLGQHAQYARINGHLASVKTQLHRGDCVEIGAKESISPNPDWLEHVSTYKAYRFLRSYFSKLPVPKYKLCPNCSPIPGEEVVGFKSSDGEVTLHRRDCNAAIRQASQDGDSIIDVTFEEDAEFLYNVTICITGIDRYHLLQDVIECITSQQLSINSLKTSTIDCIATCTIDFAVHSACELQLTIDKLYAIEGIDHVQRER